MKSFRVYFVTLDGDRVSGTLMRWLELFFDSPPPAAIGNNEEEVYAKLEERLIQMEADDANDLNRYLWQEQFEMKRVDVDVFPQNYIKRRSVIGASRIPLRVTYAFSELPTGGYRLMMPRFGWSFVVEELSIASEVITHAISAAMLGDSPRSVYYFRYTGREYVQAWEPQFLQRRIQEQGDDDDGEIELPVMAQIAEEWVSKAERKRLPLVVGSDPVFDQNAPLFQRDPLPSILLVGRSGVGKTTFVQRLAKHLLLLKRGKLGKRKHINLYATSADRIVAGMTYLGMWQERCIEIVDELSHEGHYLYVDRLIDLMSPQSAGASIAELLAPAVLGRELSLIAECSESELIRCRQRSSAFVEAFQVVRINETPASQLLLLLERFQAKAKSNLEIHDDAYKRAVSHLGAFRRDVAFPGKGVAFFRWLNREADGGDDDDDSKPKQAMYPADMSAAFSRYSGLPVELIADDVPAGVATISERLQKRIIGQDSACTSVARVLARFKAGLNDPKRPVGTLFFAGPTGVGKTELAKQLATYMFGDKNRMIRVDMSEYMSYGSSQRLLAVGKGVISLAEQVRRQPLCVVLLDEIEKAHPEVFDLLLGILGEGRLTDASGRLVDFRMALIILTSNLGAGKSRATGFGERDVHDYLRAVTKHFRPEFFNRLDKVLSFGALTPANVRSIVDLELDDARKRTGIARRNLTLRISDDARAELARRGYDEELGARPLKRVIEELIVTPLAVKIAEDPAFADREVQITKHPAPGDVQI